MFIILRYNIHACINITFKALLQGKYSFIDQIMIPDLSIAHIMPKPKYAVKYKLISLFREIQQISQIYSSFVELLTFLDKFSDALEIFVDLLWIQNFQRCRWKRNQGLPQAFLIYKFEAHHQGQLPLVRALETTQQNKLCLTSQFF